MSAQSVVQVTKHDTNKIAYNTTAIIGDTAGVVSIINKNGDTITVGMAVGIPIYLNIKNCVVKSTGTTAGNISALI